MKETKFWKVGFIILFIVVVGVVAFLAYSYGKGKLSLSTTKDQELTATATPTASVESETQKIIAAVYAKKGFKKSEYTVSVSKIEGNYAIGGIKPTVEDVGGAYFLAAKVNGVWTLIHDGQASPFCSALTGLNFPKDMVPECLNAQGGVDKP